jgi:hypothetical protein
VCSRERQGAPFTADAEQPRSVASPIHDRNASFRFSCNVRRRQMHRLGDGGHGGPTTGATARRIFSSSSVKSSTVRCRPAR